MLTHALQNEEREQHDTIRQLKVLRDSLQEEANSDLPVAVASLEAAKTVKSHFHHSCRDAKFIFSNQDAITEKESIMQQFQELMERKAEVDRAQVPLIEQLKDIRAQVDEFEERRTAVTVSLGEA